MNFGENLKLIRNQKKMSQEKLAEIVGVSRQSISKWEVGDAYPEMNNILQLCKIFDCKLNDLVHEDMSDFNSLDEEIIMNVVKFKDDQQKKMKGITKALFIISRIAKIASIVGMCMVSLTMLLVPVAVSNVKFLDGKVEIIGNTVKIEEDIETYNKIKEVFEGNSNLINTLQVEFILLSLIVVIYVGYRLFKKLDKLFTNLHNGETPFTLDNINTIKSIVKDYLLIIFIPDICGLIFGIIVGIDMNVEVLTLTEIITILVIISISYIFEYGYEIQKDSKGVMYNEK